MEVNGAMSWGRIQDALHDCVCSEDGCHAYIDESGNPHSLDFGPYVVVAVIVPSKCIDIVSKRLSDGIRWILGPIASELSWFPHDAEIHASEIVQGIGIWRRVKLEEKQRVLIEYAELLNNLPITVVAVIVRRELGSRVFNWRGLRLHTYKMLLERILMAPGKSPNKLVVIVDSSSSKEDKNIELDINLGIKSGYVDATHTSVNIKFADSKIESMLQAADFYAYMIRQAEMHRYKIQRGKYIIDIETPLLKAFSKVRRCPDTGGLEGCGIKRWIIRDKGDIR